MNLALFDFDGTITFGDTWTPFMRLAVKPVRQTFGRFVLIPAYAKYKCGVMPVGGMRESAIRVGLTGEPARDVRALGSQYACETLPALVRPRATERLAWHKSRGDDVVVVSAVTAPFFSAALSARDRYSLRALRERSSASRENKDACEEREYRQNRPNR